MGRPGQPFFELVNLAPPPQSVPTLDPASPWVGWDHDQPGVWPIADDGRPDLNGHPGPTWLDELAARVRVRLARSRQSRSSVTATGSRRTSGGSTVFPMSSTTGTASWPAPSQPWSVPLLPSSQPPEPPAARRPLRRPPPSSQPTKTPRGAPWDDDQRQVSWAAGLWVRALNAKKAALQADRGPVLRRLEIEAVDRLRLAGAWLGQSESR